MNIDTVPAIRIVVSDCPDYYTASKAAFGQAVEVLGTGALNLADCTKRLADGAFLFTYSVVEDALMGATHPKG